MLNTNNFIKNKIKKKLNRMTLTEIRMTLLHFENIHDNPSLLSIEIISASQLQPQQLWQMAENSNNATFTIL